MPSSNVVRVPTLVPPLSGIGVSMLACGDAHTLALTQEGRVLALGANASGQLGWGTMGAGQWEATEVQGLTSARYVMLQMDRVPIMTLGRKMEWAGG